MVDKALVRAVASVVKQAGVRLRSYGERAIATSTKANGDLVTEADIAIEQFLKDQLGELLPEAGFYAEESGALRDDQDYCWVIDPLDGTTNFAHGIPYYGISVALTYKDDPILGVIYRPVQDELYTAGSGLGAFCNGETCRIQQKRSLSEGVLALRPRVPEDIEQADYFSQVVQQVMHDAFAFRYFGAIAIDVALVVANQFDGMAFVGGRWWDIAAGIVLIQEAGGRMTDMQGGKLGRDFQAFFAGSPQIHDALMLLAQKTAIRLKK